MHTISDTHDVRQKQMLIASVSLIDLAFDRPLDYEIPHPLSHQIKRGTLVRVPVRGILRTGYIFEIKQQSSFSKLVSIHSVLPEEDQLSEEMFELATWMSQYYNAPFRQVLKNILPASIRKTTVHSHKEQYFVQRTLSKEKLREICIQLRDKHPAQAKVIDTLLMTEKGVLLSELLEKAEISKSPIETLEKRGLISLQKIRIDRSPLINEEYFKTEPKTLNPEQQLAYENIVEKIKQKEFATHLLYGVTGSGKTEVYLQAIAFALQSGLSTLMLVPEIALTGQTIERFRARFDDAIAILHYRLSPGERFDEWHRIRRGEVNIVVGARSALFCPLRHLGLIIVDEEHDGSYKQTEETPCYHARDVAVMRGKLNSAVVLLGTATPSVESYSNTLNGKYTLSKLSYRTQSSTLPHVTIVDMKKEYEKADGFTVFSELLINRIKSKLAQGEQTILFLNRRGYHTSLCCKGCGHMFTCPSCSITLTFHRNENTLACHLCDFRSSPKALNCPTCKNNEAVKYQGIGTEQVERAVHALFPEARTLRIDSDTTRHKGSLERLFRAFSTQKADILIGTQMVTKGLHFPAVTLVSVLNSDSGLQIPDFRASERVFQVLTQVAGRAGRGALAGEVIIQTQMPDNPTIACASQQDFEAFFHSEIEIRKLFGYPPFSHFVKLTFSGEDASYTQQIANQMRSHLMHGLPKEYTVHPIVPSGYAKIKDLFRFQCLVRGKNVYQINHIIKEILKNKPLPRQIKLHIDVDPLSTFF